MDESVIKGGKNVCNTEHGFSLANLRAKGDNSFLFLYLSFTGGHVSRLGLREPEDDQENTGVKHP